MQDLCEDLGHLSDAEIAYGCARYRRSGNKFFPSPGELLAMCKNQFDAPRGKSYAALPELPPPMDPERAQEVIRSTYRKLEYFPQAEASLGHKEEILARPPIPFVPMTEERKAELLEALARIMPRSHYEEPVS